MYFDTSILRSRRAILFQRLLPKLGWQAHLTMCFSFAAKMAADPNQLKELREFLRARNEDSSMTLFVGSERHRGKQVENKERHFEEVGKGKYARTPVCLTMKTTDLKRFMLRLI